MRYLIISDIHANLAAFEAVLEDAPSFDKIWCLGDMVGYGPDPNECIERLLDLPHICVAGNHDWAAIGEVPLEDFNPDAQRACIWTQEKLSPSSREYLKNLPTRLIEGDFTLVHGSPRHPVWEYILHTAIAEPNFAHFETRFCIVGHTHAPLIFIQSGSSCHPYHLLRSKKSCNLQGKSFSSFASSCNSASDMVCHPYHLLRSEKSCNLQGKSFSSFASSCNSASDTVCKAFLPQPNHLLYLGKERLIINPGSVGQPRDGDPRASYVILDTERLSIQYRRIPYQIEVTQEKMMKEGLPSRLIIRLGYGW